MNITGGQVSPNLSLTPDMTRRERAMLMYLLWPIAFLGIFPSYLLTPLHFSVSAFLL
jgi:NADH:ubiquinone oxidoreductase subunit 4 (subunit M)